MEFPESVTTVTKKGKREIRSLVERGEFVLYEYLDPDSGKAVSNKRKLVLKGDDRREFFMIPTKDGRHLLIPTEAKGPVAVWDRGRVVEL